MKIHYKILIPMYVCLWASFLIIGISIYYITYQKNLENSFNHLQTRSDFTQIIVQNYFSEIHEKLSEFSQSPENKRNISELSKYQLQIHSQQYKNASEEINNAIAHFTQIYPEVLDIIFVDSYGIALYSLSDKLTQGIYIDNIYGKWFLPRLKQGTFISDIRLKDNSMSYVFASQPIYDEQAIFMWWVIIEFQTENLDKNILSQTSLWDTGESYILWRDGIVKTSLINNEITKFYTKILTDIYHACFENQQEKIQNVSYKNILWKQVIWRYHYLADIDMCIITEIELSEVLESTKYVTNFLILGGIWILIFVSLLIHVFIKNITWPLRYLSDKIEQIRKSGNKNITLRKFYRDEVWDLTANFQEMLQELSAIDKKIHDTVLSQTKEIRKKQKETIKLNSNLIKFEEALKKATDYIAIFNAHHEIIYINNALEKETGYALKQCLGKKSEKFWRKLEGKENMQKIWKQVEKSKLWCTEEIITNRIDWSSFMSQVHMSPILNSSNEIEFYLSIENDITQEQEVKKMKDEFISLVSHELRTPMTVIKWYTQLFLDSKIWDINQEQKKYLERIKWNSEQLISMVNDMLDIEKLNSWKMTFDYVPVNISYIIEECIEEMTPMCEEKNITLKYSKKKVPTISSDGKKIKQVLVNLIRNAYKFTPEWWSISLKTIKHKWSIKVEVIDTGIGIKKEDFSKVFQKFWQVDSQLQKQHKWTWLWLNICQMIVENLGWKIGFNSIHKSWSTFYFELPTS